LIYCSVFVKWSMFPKPNLLVAAFLQVILLEPTSAADSKPDECGLASVYSTDSEDTAIAFGIKPDITRTCCHVWF
jgi:hypothetical protein